MVLVAHIITVPTGEDVMRKIISFCQQSQSTIGRGISVLSAIGAVSTVVVRQPSTCGTVIHQGIFDLLSLNGSYVPIPADNGASPENGAIPNLSGGLSITFARPDTSVIAGEIGGVLIAASEVQVILGSFVHSDQKTEVKKRNVKKDKHGRNPLIEGTSCRVGAI